MKSKLGMLSVLVLAMAGPALANIEPYPESVLVESKQTLSRAEVIAEMQRSGLPSIGEAGDPFVEPAGPGKSRAQVIAELEAASRLGLVSVGEGDLKFATPEQEQQIADAGQRAAEAVFVAASGR